ncbi:gliding motility lipoprotein GldK [Flavobacterium lindanitolerans]|jgi:gliding motility-associated lipoprotein GldK|uniref:Gliding motility-associated lipoprotein GldK n=1 Tax=Flavobacterium lindanitolerans TaxID=428988 RepID=A0A497VE91_9FLAO|nr:gliding motility lipoprotein GldK [Flavobacterium lindanitolerans]MDQ7959699.1 gliding motility lipoprotein GldK [Flavobacterium lindanitolerans]PKW29486.1 protein involved in gliding motility GldK [Flavobacterium lindanitolerans]RLJ35013.1 gliding motility-associated lipoprotein GldK [Flavobacterium lindanitolerans]THD31632.1 MAG: gliding motility lipoprotein GldK [Flavobacterium johnsoniae]
MKKFIALAALASVLTSCGSSDKGELVGVKGRKWHPEKPYGMTLVPGGAFIMGKSDDDLANVQDAPTKTVTVRSFYMDETEITNSEYKQFVNWVKDSTIRMRLAILAEEVGQTKGTGGIGEFAFDDTDPATMSPYDKYMYENYYSVGTGDDPYAGRKLNKKVKLITDPQKYPDEYYVEVMDSMYLPAAESYNGLRTIDVSKLKFRYSEANLNDAVKKKGRKDFYKKTEPIEIYPDTTVWIKDFAYSYNEPMHNDYFWHQAYDDYPVVGVTWKQAKAFCAWRTLYKNAYIKAKKKGRNQINSFRLPTEAEWEYAARGGLESGTFPWGGPYAKNDRGCFLANFKPNRGDYAADGALYTVEAKSYEPNDYNLYNMSGNVAEWTNSSYDASSYEYVSTMNPNVPDAKNERKVTRGGSWKDVAYFLQVSTRDFEYADSARSFIGFRTVQDYMGVQNTGNTPK